MVTVATLLVLLPWTVRNNRVIGHPTPFGVGLWQNLWQATVPYEIGNEWANDQFMGEESRRALRAASPGELDGVFREMAVSRVRAAPLETFTQRLRRYPYLWINSSFYLPPDVLGGAAEAFSLLLAERRWGWAMMKVGAIGLFCLLPLVMGLTGVFCVSWKDALLLVSVPAAVASLHFVLGICEYRYALPALPCFAILAAGPVGALVTRVGSSPS